MPSSASLSTDKSMPKFKLSRTCSRTVSSPFSPLTTDFLTTGSCSPAPEKVSQLIIFGIGRTNFDASTSIVPETEPILTADKPSFWSTEKSKSKPITSLLIKLKMSLNQDW